jgi:phosphatidylglycerophosphate synthase
VVVPVVTWEQYAADWSGLHGGVDLGNVRPGVRRWLRLGFVVARWLQRARVPAGAVTALGLMSSIVVAVVVTHGSGGILLAALLVFLATLADTVDGALAVLSGHTTRLGYVYDAVVDRIGEACWLIALWRIGAAGHVAVAAGALAWLHEYVRSRGNAAGMTEITAVTVGERPTRVMVTIGGLVLAGLAETFNPHVAAGIAAITTATWIVLGLIGITQLLAAVHRALAGQSWPRWRPTGTPNATPPSAPPAPVPASTMRPATPSDPGPIGAAARPDGTSTDATSRRREVSARDRDIGDSGISDVVSYAAPSADEPSEPSPDLALREPTLDDLLGDAGARVRSAVGKYGRSVTVYRSQAAGAPEVDATDTTSTDDGTDAPDVKETTDAAYATEVTDAEADSREANGTAGAEVNGAASAEANGAPTAEVTDVAGAEVIGTNADAEVRSVNDTATKVGGSGSGGPGGDPGGSGGSGRDPAGSGGPGRDPAGSGGTNGEHATGPEPDGPSRAENAERASGPSRGSKIRAHSRARIRFSRRSRGGTAKSMAEDAGRGPGSGPATSAGSDQSDDG